MRSSPRKRLVWWAVGSLCALCGTLLVVFAVVSAFLAGSGASLANLSTVHLTVMTVGVVLVVVGRLVGWKLGGLGAARAGAVRGGPPQQSTLERLGYRVPPESSDEETDDEEPATTAAPADPDRLVVCGECGTRNELGFGYCRECAAQLSE